MTRSPLRLSFVLAGLLMVAAATFAAASLAQPQAAPQTTQECNKVKVCVHVVGPWVAVPGTGEATWLLECPKRQGSVAGTDARASSAHIHIWFDAQNGAPIQQGITTGSFLLFHAISDDGKPGAFEPFLGCIPTKAQSSSRSTLSARRVRAASALPGTAVGVPLDPHAKLVALEVGSTQTATQTCPTGETLVGSWSGLAFNTRTPPDVASVLGIVSTTTTVVGRSVKGVIQTGSLPFADEPVVQIGAVCAP
jgi:hypothetical protein